MIDSHCHLNDEKLIHDLDNILKEARDLGVNEIIVPAYSLESSVAAMELSNSYEELSCVLGIHPHNHKDSLTDLKKDMEELEDLIILGLKEKKYKFLGIGEIGLDYHYEGYSKELQEAYFRAQLELALKYNLPVVIHTRESQDDTVKILMDYKGKLRGVFHCFSGNITDALMLLDTFDFYLSFGGPITFKSNEMGREVIKGVPLERILIETDAPYLTPHPHRGKVNYPKYVSLVLDKISELKEIDVMECERVINKNTYDLFMKGNE